MDGKSIALTAEFGRVFVLAFSVLLLKVSLKYLQKGNVLAVSQDRSQKEKDAVHFECLRVGVDLAIIGLVAYLNILFIAAHRRAAPFSLADQINILVIVVLLIVSVVATMIFDSAEKAFLRGIFIPNILGFAAVWISAQAFWIVMRMPP